MDDVKFVQISPLVVGSSYLCYALDSNGGVWLSIGGGGFYEVPVISVAVLPQPFSPGAAGKPF